MIDESIDYVSFLKRKNFIGQIDPWRRDDEGKPILSLLTKTQDAIDECKNWSNQDFTRQEFVKYLNTNGIYVFSNIAEFNKVKDVIHLEEALNNSKSSRNCSTKKKREISPEHREKMRKQAKKMNEMKKASTSLA